MDIISHKEKFYVFNTLLCLVHSMQRKIIMIDLRNENVVIGKIQSVDGYMNIVMEDVIFRNSYDLEYPYDLFYVQARNIRYIHIPDNVQIIPSIKNHIQKLTKKPNIKPSNTLRMKRILQRHQATLDEINKSQTPAD